MMREKVEIREMCRGELAVALEWAAREGWNPGLNDADCFYPVDPRGFFMAFVDGNPVGSVSAVAYNEHFGFVGFFIVLPEFRGGSVGVELGKKALERLEGRNIGIDGVEKKIKNYMWCGFTLAHNNIRYEGISKGGGRKDGIVPTSAISRDALAEFDYRFFPAPRGDFITLWAAQPGAVSLCARQGSQITGYATARPCRTGYKIAPLFAESSGEAEALFDSVCASLPQGTSVYLDIPAINVQAVSLAEKRGMKPVFKTARMYSRAAPKLPFDKIYGITSFELG